MPYWGQLGFQDAVSPVISQLIGFHDHAIVVLVIIITFVTFVLASLITNQLITKVITEDHLVETVWTLVPAFILLTLALPSLRLLYIIDEVIDPSFTIKVVGSQWYWSYEYDDFIGPSGRLGGASYIVPEDDLTALTPFRLLEVDNRLILPCHTNLRMLVTATDVIHSWAVPRLGVKVDAVPGRLNQLGMIIIEPGVFYGFCSEICGANHSFMPIGIEAWRSTSFVELIKEWKVVSRI